MGHYPGGYPSTPHISTADANAYATVFPLPDGSGNFTPALIFGDQSVNSLDPGVFNGDTEPALALSDAAGDDIIYIQGSGLNFEIRGVGGPQVVEYLSHVFQSTAILGNAIDLQIGIAGTASYIRHNIAGDDSLAIAPGAPVIFCTPANRASDPGLGTVIQPKVYIFSDTSFGTATDQFLELLHSAGQAVVGSGFGPVRLRSSEHSNAGIDFQHNSELLSAVSGATVSTSGLIPANAFLLGVTTRITTGLGTSNGTTAFNVGDGSDADRFGVQSTLTENETTDNDDATADPTGFSTSARDVTLTAVGGDFDGTGAVRVVAHYIEIAAPSN